jgi:DNA topoisomerase-2
MANKKIGNMRRIIGLNYTKEYYDIKDLRYGHIIIITDQDHDISHIKGLLINFFHVFVHLL